MDSIPPRDEIVRLIQDEQERFADQEHRIQGGQAELNRVLDRLLGRSVVRKRPRSIGEAELRRFLAEARITAQLDHPAIVPLLQFGMDGQGPFYLMPEVRGDHLGYVLAQLLEDDPAICRAYGMPRRLQIFRMVCGAVAHAHHRGVVHRDIKPDQVLLGPHSEVLLTDWGLATFEGGAGALAAGDPRYQPPERLTGRAVPAHPAQDVYSLGALLFHLLALRPPVGDRREYESPEDYLARVRDDIGHLPSASRVSWEGFADSAWDDLCAWCLAVEPQDRPAHAGELFDQVESTLWELEEAERRRIAAEDALASARASQRDMLRTRHAHREARRQRLDARCEIPQHAPPEARRQLWQLEDREHDLGLAVTRGFAEAERLFELALSHDPEFVEARDGLANLYQDRLQEAESVNDGRGRAYAMERLRNVDDGSRLARLRRPAYVSVDVPVRGVQVRTAPLVERDRQLVPGPWIAGGGNLPSGRHAVEVSAPGRATARYALGSSPGRRVRLAPRLPHLTDIPDGFAYVPAGFALLEGDPGTETAWRVRERAMPDYALAVFPVTMGEYRDFLEAGGFGPDEYLVPRDQGDGQPLLKWARGRWIVPREDPHGDPMTPDMPVLSVTAQAAEAYARWRSETGGRSYRLPTRDEWEYAARSGDGRLYPWGDRLEPGFCWAGEAQSGKPVPNRIGAKATDVAPCGVRDLSGGIGDWMADDFDGEGRRHVAGGTWFALGQSLRLSRRFGFFPDRLSAGIGFRLLLELD